MITNLSLVAATRAATIANSASQINQSQIALNSQNCIQEVANLTSKTVMNICTGQTTIVPYGAYDVILLVAVCTMLSLFVVFVLLIINDILHERY